METSAHCSDAEEQGKNIGPCGGKAHGWRCAHMPALRRFDSGFHFILMQVLYLGLQEGFFTTSTLKDAVKCQEDMTRASAQDERISVARGNDQIAKLRNTKILFVSLRPF